MNTPQDSLLGHDTAYPSAYDAGLLFPIPRRAAREQIGVDDTALPFVGLDRWQAYELGWLDAHGKPQVGVATFSVPCTSPSLIESKSLKLYLNSLNDARFDSADALRACITGDLSAAAGAPVDMQFGLPPLSITATGESLDAQILAFSAYGPPQPQLLGADAHTLVEETLSTALFKSNCPVTGQPDWASIVIAYRGPKLDRAGLLRYLVSFRHHAEFHEQCVERVFSELLARCAPTELSVEARFTRRGGLDINPWRATPGFAAPSPQRELRQ